MRRLPGAAALVALAVLALPGCSDQGGGDRTAVASFYPLAYAAGRIAGPGWEVIDLTPPGAEAHDVELSLEDRAAIEDADLVIHLGDIGFQPQVEEAAKDTEGRVLTLAEKLIHHQEGQELEEGIDPHIWLNPGSMRTMASLIANAFIALDPDGRAGYLARADRLRSELERLDQRYRDVLNIRQCRYGTLVVSHEAFNYMAGRYAFRQYGLAGLTPEGEPTTARLAETERLIEEGQAGAVFYEAGGESQRAAKAVASDAGVPTLPLSTLESEPVEGDYITVMEDNLDSLRKGLGCP